MAILLTGTTIGGNIALHAGNVSTYALPIGAGTSTGMKIFYTSLTNNDDWSNSPISIMERGLVGSAQSAAQYAPNLNFHWSGRVSKSFWLDSSGVLRFGEYNGSGIPATDGTIAAATFSGALSGNATTATTLQTARTIGGVSFNGSANINLPGVNTAGNQNTTGNAASATILQTTRTINGTNFNGSADITTANWGTARTITIGNTGKSVNGGGNVSWSLGEIQAEYQVPLNTLRNNLGSPTVREAALFHGQFNNKFRFLSPTLQEESTDGTTWVTSTRASAAVLGDMMIGEGQGTSFSAIPSAAVGTYGAYRLTWNVVGSTGYVFLNALYIFNSTNGNTVNITIEALHNTNGWVTITGPHATSNWPGHAYIPHSNIPYSNSSSQYSQVRITFTTTHNTNINAFTIYGIEWFGGYPQGRRNAEYYDRDRNVYFPASIQGSRLISTVASGTAPLSVTSTTVVGNLNADMVDGYHSSSLWRSDGGSWNPSANILLGQTANNQEWSFDITRNGYTGGYWQVWDSANSTMLKVDAVSGKVSAPYNFVGNLEGSATTLATARTLTIGATGKTFNGSANVSWTLAEIGAQAAGSYAAASHTHSDATTSVAGFMSTADKTKLDGIAASANNYSLPLATASVRGGVKIGYTANGKNYPVQLSSEQMYVNVPWTDTDTNTTYSAGTGLTLSGTTFSVTSGTYAAASHTHAISDVTGLQSALDGKQTAGSYAASSHTHGIGDITDSTRWWNNFGDSHGTRTAFDASTPSYGFGWRYVQGSTNGPGVNGATQYYALYVGLGNQYPATGAGSYGMQLAIPRNVTTPYLAIRFNENNSLQSWQKISAGYADSAGAVAWTNVSGRPTNVSSFTNDAGYITSYTDTNTVTSVGVSGDLSTGNITLVGSGATSISKSSGTITISSTDTNTTYSAGTGLTLSGTTFSVTAGSYAAASHNHTTLTGVTSIGFAAEASDLASISTTINGSGTYFDFNLTDDNNNDWWRWRFTPSGSTVYDAMTLKPLSNGNADLTISGSVFADNLAISNWNTAFGWGNHASIGYLTSSSLSGYATQTYVNTAISNLVNSAPAALDTLNELAAALGNDSSFSTTITNSIATKAPLASPALTGTPTAPTAATSTNTTQIATTAFVKAQGYSTTTGTVTSVGGTGTVSGLSLSGTVTGAGNLTLGGTLSLTSGNVTTALGYTPYNATNPNGYITGISFANVSSKPTTISGYGITDAITTANIGSQSVSYAATAGSAPNGSNINQFYNVNSGDGNGLRFWGGSDSYKISMGVGALYQYGPVTDYSIKMQMNDSSTGRGFTWGRISYAPIAALNSTSGDMEVAGYYKSYGYRGNGNVGGTGSASWHPDGIYCGSTMWQYGSLYKNNTGIYNVSEMAMHSGPYLQTYNTRNLIVKAADSNDAVGILGQKSAGGFAFQIYGDGSNYGFLGGAWAGWDLRKTVNGVMYMNNDNTYYLQTNSTSNFVALNIQGNAVVHAGNIGSQSVSYATTAGTANAVAWGNVSSKPSLLMYYQGFTLDANTMDGNSTGFTYSVNAPFTGPIARFSETGYSLQLNAAYHGGGTGIAFRTRNGDAGSFNPWRVLLNDSNYTAYSPSLTGSGASGSWGISVTGSAGSVAWTNVSSRPTALSQFTNDLGNYGGWITGINSGNVTTALGFTPYNATNPSGYITSSGSISGSAGSVTGLTLNSSANGINPDSVTQNQIGYNTSVSLFGQTDGGLYSSAYSSAWIHQIYGDFRTGQIAIRGKNSGTWQAWRTVLDSSNFSTWAAAASHTHTIANITGLQTALDGKQAAGSYAAASHTHTIANVTGLQTALDGKAASSHTHAISDVTGLQTALDGKQASGSYLTTSGKAADSNLLDGLDLHTGRNNEVNKVVRTDANGYIQAGWINTTSGNTTSTLTDIYVNTNDGYIRKATPAHFRSQITDGVYAPVSHTHTIANVTGLQTALDGKAASSHTHTIANVTGLQTALDGKQASGSYLTTSGKAADSELIDGIDSSRIVYGDGSRGKSISRAGASANASDSTNASGFYFGNNVTGLPTTDYWNWVTVAANSWSGSDGYQFQLAGSFWGDDYRIRRMTSGTNHGWVSLIHSGNIGSQSVSYASTAGSATSATTAGSATIATQLNKFGDIYGQDWNTYYINGKMIVSSVYGGSGPNFPTGAYNYGAMLSYGVTGSDFFQVYFPENGALQGGAFRKLHYRTGWNGSWSPWKSVVDQEGQVCTIAGSNQTGIEIHSNVGYNQDPLTYFLMRGQADTSWKALKVRLTGDAGGQDIEFRRIAENGTDARMWYVPRGANTVNFDYPIVQPSDSRLKDNITPISTPVDKIKSLRGVEFDWNSGEHVGTHDIGLIAQDVEAVLPEAVTTQEDGYKNLAYTKVIPLLVEAMKEQQAMIEALKAEIELLKNK